MAAGRRAARTYCSPTWLARPPVATHQRSHVPPVSYRPTPSAPPKARRCRRLPATRLPHPPFVQALLAKLLHNIM